MAPLHRAAGCVTLVAHQSCASCPRLSNIFVHSLCVYQFTSLLYHLSTTWSFDTGHTDTQLSNQPSRTENFSDSTPVRSYWSRPHYKYSLHYLYCNRL